MKCLLETFKVVVRIYNTKCSKSVMCCDFHVYIERKCAAADLNHPFQFKQASHLFSLVLMTIL